MPRELRKRASRPNYAALFEDDGDEENESGAPAQDDDAASGSDFAPEKDAPAAADNDESALSAVDEDELMEDASEPEEVFAQKKKASNSKVQQKKPKYSVSLVPSISLSRQGTLPSVHHRHRAVSLYESQGQVERLAQKPHLFSTDKIILTNAWGKNSIILNRVAKSWGFNAGSGPLWELLEDRGWYKESAGSFQDPNERQRRPHVYQDLDAYSQWEVLSPPDAKAYVPNAGSGGTEHEIKCSFGPHDTQTQTRLRTFSQIALENLLPGSSSHVLNAGAPVWGIDWCPIHVDTRSALMHRQYLAVAPLPTSDYTTRIGVNVPRPNKACIQIWSLNPPLESSDTGQSYGPKSGYMKCELVLCIDVGPAHDIKWCPLPSHESLVEPHKAGAPPRRLGLLAGTFEDGSLSVFSVPFPDDIRTDTLSGEPIFIRISEPLARFVLEDTVCWCLDWANSEVIAVGCTNGCIAVYDISEALRNPNFSNTHLPAHYFSAHQSAIRSVAWIRAPTPTATAELTSDDPTVITSAGYDGLLAACDIRAPCPNAIYRTRDVISTVCYAPYCGGPVGIDQGQVKSVSLAPSMLNKGHTVTEPDGSLWSLNASDYHPQIAIGAADGSCSTTNTLRTTRRGGSVPFFSYKIYQLDYNRQTKDYRMLERFLPKEIDKIAGNKLKSVPKATAAWPPEVGVHRVVWNSGNGLGRSGLLASATASGLCRVDWLSGRWSRDRVPYTGIEGIRGEIEADDMDDDSD